MVAALFCYAFFFFFLIINLYFLLRVVIAQNFNAAVKLAIRRGAPTNDANAEIKHNQWQQKENQEDAQSNLKRYALFKTFQSLNHNLLFLLKDNFWFHLFSLYLSLITLLIYYLLILLIVMKRKQIGII